MNKTLKNSRQIEKDQNQIKKLLKRHKISHRMKIRSNKIKVRIKSLRKQKRIKIKRIKKLVNR